MGGRQSNAQYQFTLNSEDLSALYSWVPRITQELQQRPELRDVSSDQQQNGLEADLVIDRETASRLGINASMIDNTLYDAFGQRQVSTIYNPLNQYHVVMEVAPEYWQSPDTLKYLYISTAGGSVGGVQEPTRSQGRWWAAKQVTSAASVAARYARAISRRTSLRRAGTAARRPEPR